MTKVAEPTWYDTVVDGSESECRDLAHEFWKMPDHVFAREWVQSTLEMLIRRDDLSTRDIGLLLSSVRERYRNNTNGWPKIARGLTKWTKMSNSKRGEGAS